MTKANSVEMEIDEMQCKTCHELLPITEFYWTKKGRFMTECKSCQRERQRKWSESHPGYLLKWQRKNRDKVCGYTQKFYAKNGYRPSVKHAQRIKEWCEAHPGALTARYKVQAALRRGELKRPQECSFCGDVSRRLVAHHEDYSKPLDVVWLCSPCHARRHQTLKNSRSDGDESKNRV